MPPNLINSSAVSSANYYLGKNQKNLQQSIKRLASGKKISGPGDDPGNLAVSMKLNAQLSRISGIKNNIQNGISFLEVQDSALETAGRILNRMAELKEMGSPETFHFPITGDQNLDNYNIEFKDLQHQLYDLSQTTYNDVKVFADYATSTDGSIDTSTLAIFKGNTSADNTLEISINPDGSSDQRVSIFKSALLSALTIKGVDLDTPISRSTAGNIAPGGPLTDYTFASSESYETVPLEIISIARLNQAIENIAFLRAQNGSTQNRLNFAADHISSYETGLRSAIGRIEDVDIAEESANLAKNSILTKASAAMVAQASQSTQSIMRTLLGN